jgi:hypothetical protein
MQQVPGRDAANAELGVPGDGIPQTGIEEVSFVSLDFCQLFHLDLSPAKNRWPSYIITEECL